MSEHIKKIKGKDFDTFIKGLKNNLEEFEKLENEVKVCKCCSMSYRPGVIRNSRYGKKYEDMCNKCFIQDCHKNGLPKKLIEEQVESYIKYQKDMDMYKPMYTWPAWFNENEIRLIVDTAETVLKEEEIAKYEKYKEDLLKEAKGICKVIEKPKDQPLLREDLEKVVAVILERLDVINQKIDMKQDREHIFR